MATDFPLPISGEMGAPSPSVPPQPFNLLRSAMGALIPALLDVCCILVACVFAIVCYELDRPLDRHDGWLLWAEFSCTYGLAFIVLAQAQHLYSQRPTLLKVA